MAEPNTGTAYDVGGENKRVVPFTIQQREWLSKFHNIGILFFSTITTLRLITDHQTDMVAGCFENFAIYSYDSDSMEIDDGENYLRPNNVDQYTAGRWILRAKFDGGNIELKFYNLRADFPNEGGETYLYIDKSNGRLYRWSNFVGEYIGMSVNYSLDSGMLGGQLPVYYKDVMQVNSLPLDNQLTTVIYELLQQDGDKSPYTLWAWDGLQWNGVGGSTSETDPLFQQWLLTADIVESVTSTDNHIVVDNADPKNPSLSFQLVDNENLLTDDELAVVQVTSGINTGDQVGDGVTITGAGTDEDPFVATNTSLWQQKENVILNDWFQPSTGELQVIHDELYMYGLIPDRSYWSSSEVSQTSAYTFNMGTNALISELKDNPSGGYEAKIRTFITTEIHDLRESSSYGSFIFKVVDNGTDYTYWEAIFKNTQPSPWSNLAVLIGTTSTDFGEGLNNTTEIIAIDGETLAYQIVNDGAVIVDNSQIIEPKNNKFIETADIIDIDKYLKKDTTLQNSDTPEDTSLFSFWKIGVGRVKIAFSELITNFRHSQLRELSWLGSGHVGTANKLFGSDANGLAKEYDLYSVSEITLLANGWTANSQTLTVNGLLATDDLTPYPKNKTDQDLWATSELFCSAHTTDSVTFTCVTTPISDIVILLKIQKR